MSMCFTPNGLSASTAAFTMQGVEPSVPASPTPFAPSGFTGVGSGLVDVRVDAQRRVYRLRPEPLKEIDAWIEPYRRRWDRRLDRLERHLKTMDDTKGPGID